MPIRKKIICADKKNSEKTFENNLAIWRHQGNQSLIICFKFFFMFVLKSGRWNAKLLFGWSCCISQQLPLFPHFTDGVTKLSKSHKKWPNFQKNKCSSLKRFWTKMKIMILTRVWSVRSAWVAISWITRTAGDHSCHYRCHLQHYQHHFNNLSDQPARGVGRTRERLSDVTTSIGALQRTLL